MTEYVLEATLENHKELLDPTDMLVVVKFWAEWCGPCARFAGPFSELAEQYKGQVRFVAVNVDTLPQLTRDYVIRSIPNVLFLTKEKPSGADQHIGGYKTEVDEKIKALLNPVA